MREDGPRLALAPPSLDLRRLTISLPRPRCSACLHSASITSSGRSSSIEVVVVGVARRQAALNEVTFLVESHSSDDLG